MSRGLIGSQPILFISKCDQIEPNWQVQNFSCAHNVIAKDINIQLKYKHRSQQGSTVGGFLKQREAHVLVGILTFC